MTSPSLLHIFTITITVLFFNFNLSISCFSSIISFGDSLTDTGNWLLTGAETNYVGHLPYGETFFHYPTGRFSDGRIILDFIAEAMGIPHVRPFLEGSRDHDFCHGVNFAFGGATAMESGFFLERGIKLDVNYSLGVQIELFRQLLPSFCSLHCSDCRGLLSKTLFFVGEIGGNDYNIPLFKGKTLDEILTYVPHVINAISSAIDELIDLGAKTLVVPSYLPVGCLAGFLTIYPNSPKDPNNGCIIWLNKLAEYHDQKLLQELHRSRQRHPSATIIYADYYNAVMTIFNHPRDFGFGDDYLSACCGGGGPYNYNSSVDCGTEKAKVCSDPSKFICWDGMHLTEAAYRATANQLIHGPLAIPAIRNACSKDLSA